MLEKAATSDNQLSKEDYLILRAKEALATDIYAAKTWLITAKSLFPHSAKVQVNLFCILKYMFNFFLIIIHRILKFIFIYFISILTLVIN